ncbi:FAD/NAD(P)-binding domain-containing protein, partial [Mollisia scopiformis]
VRRICVIGAGPSGLAAAKFLRAENSFSEIDVYERRSTPGGLWNHSAETHGDGFEDRIPSTSPHVPLEHPAAGGESSGHYVSPVDDFMASNIPKTLMRYSDLKFSNDLQIFPSHEEILDCLQTYAEDVRGLIHYNTQVTNVELLSTSTRDKSNEMIFHKVYDAVVVASGYYSIPQVPHISGLGQWKQTYPDTVIHSKYYRRPEPYAGKRILIVGSGASGQEIATQISKVAANTYISARSNKPSLDSRITVFPSILQFDALEWSITFEDGLKLLDLDSIVFCNGYIYAYPFLESIVPSPITENGSGLKGTYHHCFFTPHPSLSFLTLPRGILYWPESLPSTAEMQKWEEDLLAATPTGQDFHSLEPPPRDGNHLNFLYDWAIQADKKQGLDMVGLGNCQRIGV